MKREKSCRYCLNMRSFGKEGSSRCPLITGKKSKVCQFFVRFDVKRKIQIGYDDGTYSELNIFPDMEFGSFKAASRYLKIYLKTEPDEKSEHYFLYPVKSEVKQ
ncbi:MAG: hypothetical protein WC976_05970 [Caldisericia bacterium]